MGLDFGLSWAPSRLLSALSDPGRNILRPAQDCYGDDPVPRLCRHLFVLWRRLRHHAVVYRRLLWGEVHGRNLRMDLAVWGGGGRIFAALDRPPAPSHRPIFNRHLHYCRRHGGVTDFAAYRAAAYGEGHRSGATDQSRFVRVPLAIVLGELPVSGPREFDLLFAASRVGASDRADFAQRPSLQNGSGRGIG